MMGFICFAFQMYAKEKVCQNEINPFS